VSAIVKANEVLLRLIKKEEDGSGIWRSKYTKGYIDGMKRAVAENNYQRQAEQAQQATRLRTPAWAKEDE
jgi:hypothetical protein